MSKKAVLRAAKRATKSMLIAVQGCSHGCLGTIFSTVNTYTEKTGQQPRVLLLCGDFQALRSKHDYASLAVPAKYRQLGAFHKYYTGEKKAPLLTIVIGGNHEASNYMWELYHGGWLAPNIYYLGAAGSILVDGVRIVGASGIYNSSNYGKGHFERVPYQGSTLRSVYHIRQYDVTRLMHLPERDHTIFLSHDWPTTIPRHGNTAALLRRKTFFREEVESDTLGSPPLLTLMKHLKPEHWFAAHLHVKFAAVYKHEAGSAKRGISDPSSLVATAEGPKENQDEIHIDADLGNGPVSQAPKQAENPDEIAIDDDLDDHVAPMQASTSADSVQLDNPDEIAIDDDFDELPSGSNGQLAPDPTTESPGEARQDMEVDKSVDFVEAASKGKTSGNATAGPSSLRTEVQPTPAPVKRARSRSRSRGRATEFLALDKCGQGKDFIQFLDIPSPRPVDPAAPAKITYDPEWLAITRAFHPYLPLEMRPGTMPSPFETDAMIQVELDRIRSQGLLVPRPVATASGALDGQNGHEEKVELVFDKGAIEVERVQKFWPTAPAEGQPGGSPSAWYTNPQTEAFCGMLGIENKINPAPR